MIGATPGDVHEFRLHDAERDAGRDPGVDRIAARLQDLEAGLGREIMAWPRSCGACP